MTRKEAIDFGEMWLELQEDSKGSNTYEFFKVATQVLKEPILEKIREEIQQKIKKRSGLNHTRSERDRNDAFLEVLDIIDKYREE